MSHFLYSSLYQEFKEMILAGRLPAGARMPSVRKCAVLRNCSRTTVENAYLQLAAEGFIISRPQSGYFVTEIASVQKQSLPEPVPDPPDIPVKYDFASHGVDRSSFRFDLWQRYIKSALRENERLLSYGEAQGEKDFREALASYVRTKRNILCSPDEIVVGAGVQSLLCILIPLLRDCRSVSFPDGSFLQGSIVFRDFGYEIHTRDKNCDVIYVAPAHMTRWGDVMPVSRRLELLRHAASRNSLILEDDYENEFVFQSQPTPSLYSLSRARNVVYLGSFSRLLLPSIRISFMILPEELQHRYRSKAAAYNQTASKAEQIALSRFIRDGHLEAQTRKLYRLYAQKRNDLETAVREVFGTEAGIRRGPAGISLAVRLASSLDSIRLHKKAQAAGLRLQVLSEEPGFLTLLLSCTSVPAEDFVPGLTVLKSLL